MSGQPLLPHHVWERRAEGKEYVEPRGSLAPSSRGFPCLPFYATLSTHFLPLPAQDTHSMLLSILFMG